MKLFDSTLSTLERSLDARLNRQNVLSGNLANADTPSYRPKDIDMKKAMSLATESNTVSGGITNEHHLSLSTQGASADQSLVDIQGGRGGIDGNEVDVDKTLVSLAENALQYGAAAKAAGKKLSILRYVASDGAA